MPVTVEAANSLGGQVEDIWATRGPVRLVITEEELTSYLALYGPDNVWQDPMAWFTAGAIHFSAQIGSGGRHKVHAVLSVNSQHGVPQIALQEASLDDKRLPRLLLLLTQEVANDALTDMHSPFSVDDIILDDGLIIITGEMH